MLDDEGVTLYTHIAPEHLPAVQQVVKRYDMRFLNNPAAFLRFGGKVYCIINSGPASMAAVNAAFREIDEITREPDPPPPPTVGDRVTAFWKWCRGTR